MESFQQAMQDAQEELARIEQRRVKLLQLIENLKALSGDELAELTPPPNYEPEGITAEIRKILSLTTVHLAATQIRDSLVQRGFEKSNPKTLLIAVHTVLGRIEKELDIIERDGKPAYKAKTLNNALSFYEAAIANTLKSLPTNEQLAEILNRMYKNLGFDLDAAKRLARSDVFKSGMRGDEKPKDTK